VSGLRLFDIMGSPLQVEALNQLGPIPPAHHPSCIHKAFPTGKAFVLLCPKAKHLGVLSEVAPLLWTEAGINVPENARS
jgi:hypothetical protein